MLNLKKLVAGVLAVTLCLAGPAGAAPGAPPQNGGDELLEELHYRVDVWILQDSIPAKVTFKRLADGRYRGEITGEAKGLLGLVSGRWRGRYTTDMALANGRLRPLVYREEAWSKNKHHLMEYRFDYDNKRLELYKPDKKKGLVKKWETPLTQTIFDGLSFYYNQRLGLMNLGQEGEVFKLPAIPYPKPEEITIRLGAPTEKGRKLMVSLVNPVFEKEKSEVYAILDGEGVPTEMWTHVLRFGKITGTLLPGGRRLNREKALAGMAAPVKAAALPPGQ